MPPTRGMFECGTFCARAGSAEKTTTTASQLLSETVSRKSLSNAPFGRVLKGETPVPPGAICASIFLSWYSLRAWREVSETHVNESSKRRTYCRCTASGVARSRQNGTRRSRRCVSEVNQFRGGRKGRTRDKLHSPFALAIDLVLGERDVLELDDRDSRQLRQVDDVGVTRVLCVATSKGISLNPHEKQLAEQAKSRRRTQCKSPMNSAEFGSAPGAPPGGAGLAEPPPGRTPVRGLAGRPGTAGRVDWQSQAQTSARAPSESQGLCVTDLVRLWLSRPGPPAVVLLLLRPTRARSRSAAAACARARSTAVRMWHRPAHDVVLHGEVGPDEVDVVVRAVPVVQLERARSSSRCHG